MPVAVPNLKPRLPSEKLLKLIAPFKVDMSKNPLIIVGIRGYYLDTLGAKGKNDRGIYDDAIFIHSPYVTANFNGNTDPSDFKKGVGKGSTKGRAHLKPGIWYSYKFGIHRQSYPAIVQQGGDVVVIRDGDPDYEDTGRFGINIHKGGLKSTSSEGCQTLYPAQWDSFYNLAKDQAVRCFGANWNKVVFPYILLENTGQV